MHKFLHHLGLIDTIKNIIAPSKKDERHEQRTFGTAPAMGSAVEVNEDKALTFTAVWAAIRLLSESVSSLPINVYEIDKNGKAANIRITISTEDKAIDNLMIQVVKNMPAWKPAVNVDGTIVNQTYRLLVGNPNGC